MIYEAPKNPLPIHQRVGQAQGVELEETKEAHVSSRLYATPNHGILTMQFTEHLWGAYCVHLSC